MQSHRHQSLEEINQSVAVPDVHQTAFWRKFLAYSGPGALVAVGYMDPGNWLTSLAGGGQFQYRLLAVLALAIIVAMFMQGLAIRLGVVARQDLAQAIDRRHYFWYRGGTGPRSIWQRVARLSSNTIDRQKSYRTSPQSRNLGRNHHAT